MKKISRKIDLSIIILSFNTKKITYDCLKSIWRSMKKKDISYEIILIDNNSHDGSPEFLSKLSKDKKKNLIFVANKDNIGFGKANNQGVKLAKGKYILLLNSDTIVLENAIEKLFRFYKKNEKQRKIAFLGPKLLNKDGSNQQSAAYFFTLPVVFAVLFLRGDYWNLTRFSPSTFKQVDWVSGACFLTTKKIYESLGGFDKNIFMYMEEVDLLYRARQKKYLTYFYPEAKIIHLGSMSSGGKTYPIIQVFKGFLFFYRKHYSKIGLFFLKLMLKAKAIFAYVIGVITNNKYLKTTYKQALEVVK